MLSRDEEQLLSLIDGGRVRADVSRLVEGGEKVSGDEAEQLVAKLIRDELTMILDSCVLEEFPVTTYVRGKGTLEVVSPVQKEIPCEVNPAGAAGSGEVVLVDAGVGGASDFRALGNVAGKAALISDARGLAAPALEARNHGAGCIVYHFPPRDADLICVYGVNTAIPALSVSNDSAAELRELLGQNGEVRVRYHTDQHSYESTSYNVVGELTGWRYPKEIVYLTAHHDAWFDGANDNMSSVAVLLEMARALSQDRPERTIRFISFGSEESGVTVDQDALYWDQGSTAYSIAHERALSGADPNETPICILNGEITGYTLGTGVQASPELMPMIQTAGGDANGLASLREVPPGWSGSDHLCLHTLGVPSAQIGHALGAEDGDKRPYMSIYHTRRDDLDHTFPEALESSTRIWLLTALRLANGGLPPLSTDRLVAAAIRGLDCTEKKSQLIESLGRLADDAETAGSRTDRLVRALALSRAVNRNIYGCQFWSIHPKFDVATTALEKLSEVRRFVEDGGDRSAVATMLDEIPTARWYRTHGPNTTAEAIRHQAGSPVLSRISPLWLGFSEIYDAAENAASAQAALDALDSVLDRVKSTAEEWAEQFLRDLDGL